MRVPSTEAAKAAQTALTRIRIRIAGSRTLRAIVVLALALGLVSLAGIALGFYATDANLVTGYAPIQPVEFSHLLHARDLGLDCRFCHVSAERGPMAGVPSTKVCMNCHAKVLPESVKLLPVRSTFSDQKPIAWIRVCKLPEFTYFDHSIHLATGVGCSTCHGRVDLMARTEQTMSLSMGFCLDCHRSPAAYLRNPRDLTNMEWQPSVSKTKGPELVASLGGRTLTPPLHCSGCHR
jgi:hypothetical protein